MPKRSLDLFDAAKLRNPRGRPRKLPRAPLAFGGSLLGKGNPNCKRPLDSKRPIHVTLRSSLARGRRSFLAPHASSVIQSVIRKTAKSSGVKIYRYQNVGNHLHLVVRIRHRRDWKGFICAVTCRLKFHLQRLWNLEIERLFDERPFTRIASWGREFVRLSDYMLKNYLDSWGIERTPWNLEQFRVALTVNVFRGGQQDRDPKPSGQVAFKL